ncbi:5-oxoprolinase (ATP-hydrolyzing) [Catenulispora acidiphila DSM 44928]|uniref:5-oxoprolinase (ATP-hydrolyzing) n=1 Tax=Catenulispora acidiphila (strain DSM 44928 / JCM 14897 / NBRC 102108 / NRRL B-24433 / ID139908) TaxID=479433 RepID=C7QEA5_CATAD|nr:hydantoinase/oxoprolinase family protein [Catenulispora acidiphila]ACU70796.1 5-oxoprolinase (ATP-hydrolyzing) [Catenulispora acidiphila DSM 44928]
MIRIGIDTGGTFTDVVAIDEDNGRAVAGKVPSTPADPSRGFLAAVRRALTLLDAVPHDIAVVSHGTTVATNQLLQGKVESLGFITTAGFEHLLEIARQSVPDGYGNSYFWVKPPRIVPADLVRGVGGRLDADGEEVRAFNTADAKEAARFLKAAGVRSIGVSFLHSYANAEHEQAMRDILEAEFPEAAVSISSDVLPEYREYERSMTTLVDAAVKPTVAGYVGRIRERLDALTGNARSVPFYVMKSNGGVLSAEEVVRQPVTTVLSGPAAGALGAALISAHAGFDRILTLDGGGTSTDVAVVLHGEPAVTTEGGVGGYPSKIPMIDVVTVGAGGGSVAWLAPEGTLKVGPRSAGADPGPVCYGRGGTEVTVTDAHLVLGRIPDGLLGGEVPLDRDAARAGLAVLGGKLGLSQEAVAAGILEISAWNQANALRQVTIKRGLDVRDFQLTAFGGSGALLACRLVDILGVRGVLVPPDPGNVSAFGLLTVDVRNDYVQTYVRRHDRVDVGRVRALFAELQASAAKALHAEGFAEPEQVFKRSADLRYFGQAYEVRVPVPEEDFGPQAAEAVVEAFHAAHEGMYGYSFRGDERQSAEWVNLRVTGIGPIRRPEIAEVAVRSGGEPEPSGVRPVWFDETPVEAAIHHRRALMHGDRVRGPAIIEEYGSTVPVHPGFVCAVDRWGNLLLTQEERPC